MRTGPGSGTLTVLFTDIAGSTELMSRVGESVFDELRRRHFSSLREAIAAHGGQEIKTTGDGLIATFTSAVEALRCAVAMQQVTDWQSRTGTAELSLRVALSLGEVALEEGDIYGQPVVEAARLVSLAAGGQVLVTALVRAVAGSRAGVGFVDLGPLELRGLPEPVPVYEVSWQLQMAEVPLPRLASGPRQFTFVAREDELARLRALWDRAQRGERSVALIAGEPGVGKTRLAGEVAQAVYATGAVVLAGRCDEGLGVPYQPFVEALRHFVTHTPAATLPSRLGRLAGELTRLVPDMATVLPDLPAPLSSDPETERYRLFDAVAAWLAALSETGPVMVVLDDLQWAARPTLLLLRHLVRSPQPMRVMIAGTYRDTELTPGHPLLELLADFRRDEAVERVALSGLDAEGVGALVEAAGGHGLGTQDTELVHIIHTETQGNPFFVEELIHHLAETGAVYRLELRWARRLSVEELGIPEGVREVVARRLGRLSARANEVLLVAAVVGEEFELAVLREAGDFDDDAFLSALEEAMAARLVGEAGWPASRFRFAHALVRATLYESLSAVRRVQLHRRVGEAVERVHGSRLDPHLSVLAHHFGLASVDGDPTPAIRYATLAGDAALAQLAHDEAVAYYGQALDLLDVSPAPVRGEQRCDLLISLGEAQRRAGDRAHRETLLGAARLAGELADSGRLTRAALANHRGFFSISNDVDVERVAMLEAALAGLAPADSALRARLLVTLASELVFSADHDRRHRLVAEGLDMSRRVGDPTTMGDVLARGYVPMFTTLDVAALREHTAELGRVASRLGDPGLEFWAHTWGFMTACLVGDPGAESLIAASTRVADDVGQPFMQWIATFGQSHLGRILGRLEEAEALAWKSLELARAAGAPDSFRMFGIQLFWIRYDQGRLEETVDLFAKAMARESVPPLTLAAYCLTLCELGRPEEARPLFEQLAQEGFALPFAWLFAATMLAEVAAALGDSERGRILYDRLAPHHALMATNGAATTGPVAHYLGMLATGLGDHDAAEAHFQEALGLEEGMGAVPWLARTRLEWAQALLAHGGPGDAGRAEEILGHSLDAARRLGLGAVQRRAELLLPAAGATPTPGGG